MAFTTADLDALDEAIASGERSATVNGRSVTYRSLDEMLRVRRFIARQLAGRRRHPLDGITTTLDRGIT